MANTVKEKSKGWQFIKSNFTNGLFIIIIGIMIVSTDARAFVIRGLMQVGLFKPDVPPMTNEPAEHFEAAPGALFTSMSGRQLNLSSLRGKVVFINFWATWCPPCIAEMPGINKLYQQFLDSANVVFIMVDADSDLNTAGSFMEKHQLSLPLYMEATVTNPALFTGTLPTTVVINKQGNIAFRKEGAANYDTDEFINFIKGLSAE